MINDVETGIAPTDNAGTETTTEGGSSLVVAVAAVVVLSIGIGAGAVMYSKGIIGGSGGSKGP